jgi:predicted Zn-dependent protease
MPGGGVSQDDMICATKRGLFISEFHYTNFVNPRALQVTGLTRNGTFLVEDGKITRAVNTMRFTQNLLEAFNNVTALSKDLTVINAGGWAAVMPSAVIEGFCFP